MFSPSAFTAAERLESLKAAALGGVAAGLMSLVLLVAHRVVNQGGLLPPGNVWFGLAGLTLLVNVAIATVSGALFALTYRYAIRQDENPQLKAGVVMAFTLVRGLAQVDAGSAIAQTFWPFLSACGESLILFGVSAMLLNFAFQQNWLARFGKA